jgi:hypothetical protein
MSNQRDWVNWVRILTDPNETTRGFSLANLEFKTKTAEEVEDEMYGTLPGDDNRQRGKFWVVTEEELMRRCPQMQAFAQGTDWFFPVEFCDSFVRPQGVEPVATRDATDEERAEALQTFESVKTKISEE